MWNITFSNIGVCKHAQFGKFLYSHIIYTWTILTEHRNRKYTHTYTNAENVCHWWKLFIVAQYQINSPSSPNVLGYIPRDVVDVNEEQHIYIYIQYCTQCKCGRIIRLFFRNSFPSSDLTEHFIFICEIISVVSEMSFHTVCFRRDVSLYIYSQYVSICAARVKRFNSEVLLICNRFGIRL